MERNMKVIRPRDHLAANPGRVNAPQINGPFGGLRNALPLWLLPPSHQLSHQRWRCRSLPLQQMVHLFRFVKLSHVRFFLVERSLLILIFLIGYTGPVTLL